jgi:tripartite-type tricarboxylate transporter receptor subunit TctC
MVDEGTVCALWHTAAVRNFDDLFTKQMIAGSTGSGSDMTMYPLAMNRLAGTKIKIISGYKGANDIYLAMEKGEVDGRCGTAVSGLRGTRPQWFTEKHINFVVQTAVEPGIDPALERVPLIMDHAKTDEERSAWRFLFAPQKMARPVLAAPNVPAERVAALREALAKTMRDPDFMANAALPPPITTTSKDSSCIRCSRVFRYMKHCSSCVPVE